MILTLKKPLIIKFVVGIMCTALTFNNNLFAQEQNETEKTLEQRAFEVEETPNQEETEEPIDNNEEEQTEESVAGEEEAKDDSKEEHIELRKQEHSTAYNVLGRELTKNEKSLRYNELSGSELKSQVLYKEQRLVIVRALLALGEGNNSKEILEKWTDSKPKTFTELVTQFTEFKEKYGSVLEGVNFTFVYNIKDDKQAFEKAAAKAYETVFGVPMEKPNDIYNYLNQKEATTYSKMIQALLQAMSPQAKQDMLFRALDNVGRPDLKENKEFVRKILSQQFTYENLKTLLADLNKKQKPTQGNQKSEQKQPNKQGQKQPQGSRQKQLQIKQ